MCHAHSIHTILFTNALHFECILYERLDSVTHSPVVDTISVSCSSIDTCNYHAYCFYWHNIHDSSLRLIKVLSIENSLVLMLIGLFRELLHIASNRTDCFALILFNNFPGIYLLIQALNMLNTFPMYLCSISKYSLETTQKL